MDAIRLQNFADWVWLGLLAAAIAVFAVGCGKDDDPGSFDIANPGVVAVIQGETTDVMLSVDRAGGYGGPVEVRIAELPPLVNSAPARIEAGEIEGVLQVWADPGAVQQGPLPLQIEALGSHGLLVDAELLVRGPAGTVDRTFGTDGVVTLDFGMEDDVIRALAVDASGRILAAGRGTNANNGFFALARFNPDGSLDGSFGSAGTVISDLTGGFDQANAIALTNAGGILAAGVGNGDIAVALYDDTGALDTAWGAGAGFVLTDAAGNSDDAMAVAVDGSDRVVVAGRAFRPGTEDDFVLARYDAVGSLDATFGTAGMTFLDFAGGFDMAQAAVLQADGQIVAAGISENPGTQLDLALARFNETDGALDTTFAGTGIIETSFSNLNDTLTSTLQQPDGRILVAGRVGSGDMILARYEADGTPDLTFGNGTGMTALDFRGTNDHAFTMALDPDDRILVAGLTFNTTNEDFALARFHPDGTLDTGFGGGRVSLDLANGHDQILALRVQPDGRILIAGRAQNGNHDDFALARIWQ